MPTKNDDTVSMKHPRWGTKITGPKSAMDVIKSRQAAGVPVQEEVPEAQRTTIGAQTVEQDEAPKEAKSKSASKKS